MFEEFTSKAMKAIMSAKLEAFYTGSVCCTTEHLLIGIVSGPSSIPLEVLKRFGLDIHKFNNRHALDYDYFNIDSRATKLLKIPFSPRSLRALDRCYNQAQKFRAPAIKPEHILLGILEAELDYGTGILYTLGKKVRKIRIALYNAIYKDNIQIKRLMDARDLERGYTFAQKVRARERAKAIAKARKEAANIIDAPDFDEAYVREHYSDDLYAYLAYYDYRRFYDRDFGKYDKPYDDEDGNDADDQYDSIHNSPDPMAYKCEYENKDIFFIQRYLQSPRNPDVDSIEIDDFRRYYDDMEAYYRLLDIYAAKSELASIPKTDFDIHVEKKLKEFTTDLTDQARFGNLDPIFGRDEEIERAVQILSRRRKNNPILIGEPGVGKTAIAEGLAQRIVKGEIPDLLSKKQVISLDIGLLVAGTQYRGEFEERLKWVMDVVRLSNKRMILFIDEVHTLVGAGSAEGAIDAANILKPPLARGELQCLGATTTDEYRQYIQKDAALERRFQPVQVNEPSIPATIQILKTLMPSYEKHHWVTITEDAITAAVELGSQYIADRFLPDKAIDLLDEAGSVVRLRTLDIKLDDKFDTFGKLLRKAVRKKERAIEIEDFAMAFQERQQELELRSMLEAITEGPNWTKKKIEKGEELLNPVVTEDDVADVVEAWTGIPVQRISDDESQKLLSLEQILQHHIIGQEQAVSAVSRAIRRARVGLRNPNRPIASFLFSGPTGVGKTELAKALAIYLFGSKDSLIRLDMSEYMERHTVSKLIGSPPGYVGYSEGGHLTEAVRKKPYSVVLFDEIEKGHPEVFNLLLQVLEDGRLTDSKGRVVTFKNTMIILTSNIGAKVIAENPLDDVDIMYGTDSKAVRDLDSLLHKELKRFFRPEFLNRLDEIIIFRPLTRRNLREIADIMLSQLQARAEANNFTFEVTYGAKEILLEEGYDPAYGARPLRRAIMNLLEDQLATKVLTKSIRPNSHIIVDTFDYKKIIIRVM